MRQLFDAAAQGVREQSVGRKNLFLDLRLLELLTGEDNHEAASISKSRKAITASAVVLLLRARSSHSLDRRTGAA